MATPREKEATDYLQRHKVFELMENLTSLLFYHRPENPREFLIEQLQKLKVSKQSGAQGPMLFTESNLDTVFTILDPADQKYITFAQYKHALKTLGIKDMNECPEGANEDKIICEMFKREAMEGLRKHAATYEQP